MPTSYIIPDGHKLAYQCITCNTVISAQEYDNLPINICDCKRATNVLGRRIRPPFNCYQPVALPK